MRRFLIGPPGPPGAPGHPGNPSAGYYDYNPRDVAGRVLTLLNGEQQPTSFHFLSPGLMKCIVVRHLDCWSVL